MKRVFVGVFVACTLAMVLPAGAGAASAWWQLDSVSEPGNLHGGAAANEVQELDVKATEGEVLVIEPISLEEEEQGRGFAKATVFPYTASPEVVQTQLESIYGTGNVEVSGGPGNSEPFLVTFKGALADSALKPMNTSLSGFAGLVGTAAVKEVTKGQADGQFVLTATNLSNGEVDGSTTPVVLRDMLPPGVTAVAALGKARGMGYGIELETLGHVQCAIASGKVVECEFKGTLTPYQSLEVEVAVVVGSSAKTGDANEVAVSGGNATPNSLRRPVTISDAPTPFGPGVYELAMFNENGSVTTQAGAHPYAVSSVVDLNRTGSIPYLPAMAKDLHFNLPTGFVGNPTPFPRCTETQFENTTGPEGSNHCPAETALGVAAITVYEPDAFSTAGAGNVGFGSFGGEGIGTRTVPIFNLTPARGEPARFGFLILATPVILDTSVRTGGDYGVTVSANNISQLAGFLTSRVTFWGIPGDPSHDRSRGWGCLDGLGPCSSDDPVNAPPFLSMPTSCTGPLQTTLQADSWAEKGVFTAPLAPPFEPSMDGCNRLPFDPSIEVAPDSQAGSTPSGLTVRVHVPQDLILSGHGLAESTVKDTKVALPAGVALNPAAADGLLACSEAQIALSADVAASCPEAAKVGSVEIKTPLLPNPLVGSVFLASQGANPFGSLVALYIVAEDPVSGVLVKLAGEVKPDPVTGQLVSTFQSTPQLPFEDLTLHFFGGSRAPLGTPALCGSYTTAATIAPWSGNAVAEASSAFQVTSGPNGSPCANPLPFAPSLTAGSTNIQTGAFSPFTMTMSRADGQQNLQSVQLHMPPGLLGTLSSVKLCGEAEANAGTCGAESLIGETIVSVGLGGNPYSVKGGRVYITGPYHGAPFGLSIVNPAKAGPYDLGQVIVRAKIEVDPITSALTITTDGSGPYVIPHILDGIPLQIQHINVIVNRPNFTFNPTNCNPTAITGTLASSEGATGAVSVPFQVTNCATLAFKPQFKVSTAAKTSRAKGASLDVKLTYPKAAWGTQANVKSVKVDLPRQLPSRLTTLQKACTAATFNANPAACPAASRIGTATATTPIIPVSLSGPAYFVSYGGAKFPELVIVLSGYGVTVQLHGETFISPAGITSSTFRSIPDVPIGGFELKLPEGPFSALGANANLCKVKGGLKMPTTFVAQNGLQIKQSTPVGVTGCAKHKAKKAKKARPRHKKK